MTATRLAGLSSFLLALAAAPVGAQPSGACFGVAGEAEARAQRLVGLDDRVTLSPSCEYALTAEGPWSAAAGIAGEADFATVYRALAQRPGATPAGDPRVIHGRRVSSGRGRDADPTPHTLMLRYCAHYLLEEQLAFRAVPEAGSGSLRIDRVADDGCDGAAIELRAVRGARGERLYGGDAEATLGTGQRSLSLPQGDWSLYAARPGSAVGLRVGVFRTQRVVTPLQNHLRSVGLEARSPVAQPALLAARWDPRGPGLLLAPTDHALSSELLWPELRTAAEAGLLWIARVESDAPPVVLGTVQLEAGQPGAQGEDPAAIRLPDTAVRDLMRARYGEEGDALAPTASDWEALFGSLAVCLTPSYHDTRTASVGGPVPDPRACAALGGLTLMQTAATEATPTRFCIQHGMQVLTSDGARQELGEPECFTLPAPGSAERPPYRIGIAGTRIALEGGDGLCVTVDGQAIEATEDGDYRLPAGLLEIRQGGGEGCAGRQGLARLRMPVVDPQRDWHPVGLYTDADPDSLACEGGEGQCPWQALAHDEATHFAYVEARHELEFRFSTSPAVAAAINEDPIQGVQVSQDVPLLSGVRGRFEGARDSAVVAYASRDAQCPAGTAYGELRQRPPFDPDALLVDATFHVFLLGVAGEEEPVECLARASFRVRSSRALLAETALDVLGFEVGVLGDAQALFFANDPVSLGLGLPLVWFRFSPGIRFVSIEVSGMLTMAASFDPAELSRVGGALTWALQLGIPEHLPRLLSIGGMLHGAAETSTIDNPLVSFFVGLNLSSLVDLAGGR